MANANFGKTTPFIVIHPVLLCLGTFSMGCGFLSCDKMVKVLIVCCNISSYSLARSHKSLELTTSLIDSTLSFCLAD